MNQWESEKGFQRNTRKKVLAVKGAAEPPSWKLAHSPLLEFCNTEIERSFVRDALPVDCLKGGLDLNQTDSHRDLLDFKNC